MQTSVKAGGGRGQGRETGSGRASGRPRRSRSAAAFHPGRTARAHLAALAAANAIPRRRVNDVLEITGLEQAAISAVVGVLFVLPLILVPMGTSIQNSVGQFLPMIIAENSLTAVKPVPHSLSPGLGFAVLCLYAAVALVIGGWALTRRDA